MYDQFVTTFAIVFMVLIGGVCFMYTVSRTNRSAVYQAPESARTGTPMPEVAEDRILSILDRSAFALGPYPYGCGGKVIINVNYDRTPVVMLTLKRGTAAVMCVSDDEFWVKHLQDRLVETDGSADQTKRAIIHNRQVLLDLLSPMGALGTLQSGQHKLIAPAAVKPSDLTEVMCPGYSHRQQL